MRLCLLPTGLFGGIPGGTPTSPRTTIIFIPGVSWYRRTWSMKVEPGYLDKTKRKYLYRNVCGAIVHQLKGNFSTVFIIILHKTKVLKKKLINIFIPVSSNGHAFIDSISSARDDVVQLIGHASRARHIRHTSRTVQFGGQDVVQHSTCVANLKATRLDATDLGDKVKR